ncbi:AI-2E family transporter [Mesorhizobium sp. M7A.F.Ca.US.010.02.1.1]|uniref:AI-2E family transporter n=1 Tax=Mesorhizobium sp. M7A.F.Ca.US.010.02.1.1 TaxID=2496743 RepID=UPI000FD2CA31|nr:AI-2E family transporter [Mesorhizobium sp. M7A.F.Ca.US.010.02.1.1]RUW87653.1 AI-2E family transporter [Mesorhizobium sp. M7A.F.Ca.US.010.02.1.1]
MLGLKQLSDMKQLRLLGVLAATAIGLYVCYLLALPFLPALTWALVLAIVLLPAHLKVEAKTRNRNLAALISVSVAAVAVGLPLIFVAQQLVREAANGANYLEEIIRGWNPDGFVSDYPRLAGVAVWIKDRLDPAGSVAAFAQWLTGQSTSLLRGSINQVVMFVLTFYLLFYFLRDRERALRWVESLSPLRPLETAYVLSRFAETVHATLIGTVFVAAVQGALGGLMFWWLGLATPVFWGLVMGLLAIVPVLGAFVIWVPAAVYLSLEGAWARAAMLTIWGGVIVAGIDNLLYPMLVGSRLRLHTVVAFIGAVGGIVLFGASGLVLGPAAIAVTISLIDILKKRLNDPPKTEVAPNS